MTLVSAVGPPGTKLSSATGAISEASISTASRPGDTAASCRGTGSVSVAIVGCGAAAPRRV